MALPALRSDWDLTTRQPATAATSVVPPPMSTTKPPAPPVRSNPAPAAVAPPPVSPTAPPPPPGQVDPGAGGGGPRLVDQPDVVPGTPYTQRGDDRPPLDRRGPARHAHQRVPPDQREPAGPAQKRVQHARGRVQVRDDPVPQRVDHLDVLRFLIGQRVRRLAHRGDLAHAGVDGDRGWLLEHDAPAGHPDERVHGAEVDPHATPEAHDAPLRACHRSP